MKRSLILLACFVLGPIADLYAQNVTIYRTSLEAINSQGGGTFGLDAGTSPSGDTYRSYVKWNADSIRAYIPSHTIIQNVVLYEVIPLDQIDDGPAFSTGIGFKFLSSVNPTDNLGTYNDIGSASAAATISYNVVENSNGTYSLTSPSGGTVSFSALTHSLQSIVNGTSSNDLIIGLENEYEGTNYEQDYWSTVEEGGHEIYMAIYWNNVTVSLAAPTYTDPGSGAYYTLTTSLGSQSSNADQPFTGSFAQGADLTITAHAPNTRSWGVGWTDGTGANPRVINPTTNFSSGANFKELQTSTDASAFSNNGQRRLIETSSGGEIWLTEVYTDNGHVWIEHSSDGGSSWILGNNGQPLDGSAGGKDPSIAFTSNSTYNYIGVVWEQPSGSTYAIMGEMFNQDIATSDVPHPVLPATTIFTQPSDGYSVDADPNLELAQGADGPFFITFDQKSASGSYQPGINWLVGYIQDSGTGWDGPFGLPQSNDTVSGTDANTTSFQMSQYPGYNNSSGIQVNYIKQEGSPAGTVYSGYISLTDNGSWQYYQANDGMISYNANVNMSPSIVSLSDTDEYAATWLEYNTLVFWNLGEKVRHYYGTDDAQSCSINIGGSDTSSSGFVAWSTNPSGSWSNSSMLFQDGSPNSSTIQTLSTSGEYVEVGNGANPNHSDMYVSSFYPFTSPYTFKTSGTLAPLSKALRLTSPHTSTTYGALASLSKGRGFIVTKGNASFIYRFGDLNVDGQNIGFVSAPDTADYGNLDVLNSALVTQPFQVNAASKVVFTQRSGFGDSTAAVNALGKNDYIDYKVEVIDNTTGGVLGTIESDSVTSSNVHPFKTGSYLLDASGLAGKTVRVKIVVSTDIPATSAPTSLNANDSLPAPIAAEIAHRIALRSNILLVKSTAQSNVALAQASSNDLFVMTLDVPTKYTLSQNYPNPFNPTTMINYQLPKDAHVTLKVYDILGRIVATLVDGEETTGYHEVSFNGSQFASGVYFYRLDAAGHVLIKKMLLVK